MEVSELSVLSVRAGKALVISRRNGRWVTIAEDDAGAVRGEKTDARRDALVAALARHGVTGEPYEPPTALNSLLLKITKRCNCACEYCYDLEDDDAMTDLPVESAKAALAEALAMAHSSDPAKHPDLGVMLHGGEPTLRWPVIEELVVYAEQEARRLGKSVTFTIQSNLSTVNDRIVEFSARHRMVWGTSLDGPPDINDRFRILANKKGTYANFEHVLKKYPAFAASIGVLTTVTSATDAHLLRIARHIKSLGLPSMKWSLFQPIGAARHTAAKYDYNLERVLQSWDELLEATLSGEFQGFDVGPITEFLQNLITGPGPNMCKRNGCGAARDMLSISSDGTIESCDCIDRKGPLSGLGRVRPGDSNALATALNSPLALTTRGRDVRTLKCGECAWLAHCGGTCLAHAGAVNAIDEKMCQITLHAYEQLANALSSGDALHRYMTSLSPA